MRSKLKDAAKDHHLGDPLDALVKSYNAKLRGWVNYFRIGNVRAALEGREVVLPPFDATEYLRVAYITDGDALIELMEAR